LIKSGSHRNLQLNLHVCLLIEAYCACVLQLLDIGKRLSAIHFRGIQIRTMSCYTLLRRFQLPWPRLVCHYLSTPFVVSIGLYFGSLFQRLVHPTLPILLTRIWPTKGFLYDILSSIKQLWISATFKVREKGDRIYPPRPVIVALPPPTIHNPLLSWGKFRQKPATRRLDESFAALVKSSHQFAR